MEPVKAKYLSEAQVKQISFLSNLMGKRILPCYFFSKNPAMVQQWQYNMCLQTSLLINAMIREMLLVWGLFDYYSVESYEGKFSEADRQRAVFAPYYNHGWVYLRSLHDEYQSLIIDTARVEGHIGVVFDDDNDVVFHLQANMLGDSGDTELVESKELDYYGLMSGNEYYTQMNSGQVYAEVRAMLGMYTQNSGMFSDTIPSGVLTPMPAFLALPETV